MCSVQHWRCEGPFFSATQKKLDATIKLSLTLPTRGSVMQLPSLELEELLALRVLEIVVRPANSEGTRYIAGTHHGDAVDRPLPY